MNALAHQTNTSADFASVAGVDQTIPEYRKTTFARKLGKVSVLAIAVTSTVGWLYFLGSSFLAFVKWI